MDRSLLKANARRQLGGSIFSENWLLALVCCLIFTAIISAVSGVSGIFSGGFSFSTTFQMVQQDFAPEEIAGSIMRLMPSMVLGTGLSSVVVLILTGPLSYGLARVFLRLVYGDERVSLDKMFDGFREDFGGNIVLGLMIDIFTFLWSLLFIIPGIVKGIAYSMAYYIKTEHPDYDWRRCINESQELMRGYKGKYFVLQLSFIGWYIVGCFTFGLGLLWVSPYVECTNANFYAWLTAQKGQAYVAPEETPEF